MESGGSAAMLAALKEAEARKTALEDELKAAEAAAPRLLPDLDVLYRAKVAALQEALAGEEGAAARERIQGSHRCGGGGADPLPCRPKGAAVDRGAGRVGGEAGAAGLRLNAESPEGAPRGFRVRCVLVAGAGFEPAAFRL